MKLIEQIPIFVVRRLEDSLKFYSRALGFDIAFRAGDPVSYAGLCRDVVQLHLIDASRTDQQPGGGRLSMITDDVDAMYQRCVAEQVEITFEIGDREYGLRDFNIADPDGNVIVFGTELKRARQ